MDENLSIYTQFLKEEKAGKRDKMLWCVGVVVWWLQ